MPAQQLYYEDVREEDDVPSVTYHLTIQRMIMAAASNRDFSPIHHNTIVAQAAGAPEMFLNNVSCLSLWDRAVSEYVGIYGRVKKVAFRITDFNCAGDSVLVKGKVTKRCQQDGQNLIELQMTLENDRGISMTGTVVVSLPRRAK